MTMKFPINVSKQKTCPVCKKAGPGTNSPVTPRPEVATLSFLAMPVTQSSIDSFFTFAWDSGVCKHPLSRTSLGAAFDAAKYVGKYDGSSQLHVEFCSTRCMRKFLMEAMNELERQINKVMPEVR